VKTSDAIDKISPALVAALGAIEGAAKKSKNPHFKSAYADLATVIDTSRSTLTEHGLAVLQGLGSVIDGKLSCTTRIIHDSGQWIESTMELPIGRNMDPQGTGSAGSYIRRYSLMAMLNMPSVDDDGNAATDQTRKPANETAQPDKNGTGPSPEGPDWWGGDGHGPSAHQAKKDGAGETFETIRNDIKAAKSETELRTVCKAYHDAVLAMPKSWRVALRNEADEQALEIGFSLTKKAA
jgi:hypothetical protein